MRRSICWYRSRPCMRRTTDLKSTDFAGKLRRFSATNQLGHCGLTSCRGSGRRSRAIRSSYFHREANTGGFRSRRLPEAGVGAVDSTRVYAHARVAQILLHTPFRRLDASFISCAIRIALLRWRAISRPCFNMMLELAGTRESNAAAVSDAPTLRRRSPFLLLSCWLASAFSMSSPCPCWRR